MTKHSMSQHGLTLLELMITIVVIGIISAIAIPSYFHHIEKKHTEEARQELRVMALDLERYFVNNQTYVGATLEGMGYSKNGLNSRSDDYRFFLSDLSKGTYRISAEANNSANVCAELILNEVGRESAVDVSGSSVVAQCW
jgi:type IV pilus assembly protein PilE